MRIENRRQNQFEFSRRKNRLATATVRIVQRDKNVASCNFASAKSNRKLMEKWCRYKHDSISHTELYTRNIRGGRTCSSNLHCKMWVVIFTSLFIIVAIHGRKEISGKSLRPSVLPTTTTTTAKGEKTQWYARFRAKCCGWQNAATFSNIIYVRTIQ